MGDAAGQLSNGIQPLHLLDLLVGQALRVFHSLSVGNVRMHDHCPFADTTGQGRDNETKPAAAFVGRQFVFPGEDSRFLLQDRVNAFDGLVGVKPAADPLRLPIVEIDLADLAADAVPKFRNVLLPDLVDDLDRPCRVEQRRPHRQGIQHGVAFRRYDEMRRHLIACERSGIRQWKDSGPCRLRSIEIAAGNAEGALLRVVDNADQALQLLPSGFIVPLLHRRVEAPQCKLQVSKSFPPAWPSPEAASGAFLQAAADCMV